MSKEKKRLDLLLEELGHFQSRQVARTAIMDGGVLVDGIKITKPGTLIKEGASIQLTSAWQIQKYVSRGGYKLEKALADFDINVNQKVCLDIGASTGGFTDCLIQAGASRVYAVDVGYGQIAWSLRTDSRVKVLERINARNLTIENLKESDPDFKTPELAVMDVSFISLAKVLPAVQNCLSPQFQIVALLKPQFEAGPEKVGKGGVVRSAEVHEEVIAQVIEKCAQLSLRALDLSFSPLKGPQGNIEFLLLLSDSGANSVDQKKIHQVVEAAHLQT
jgi:23S rRNA (cytidine1920-2'-O)/16S rRNA (cytidine1409-2'-O)-methyltransferase